MNTETVMPRLIGSSAWFGGLGVNIIVSEHCQKREQFRFPRSKKKRIRNKWAKRERNYKYTPMAYRAPENTIYCHPSIAARLRAEFPPNAPGERPPTDGVRTRQDA